MRLNRFKQFPALSLQVGGDAPGMGDERLRHLQTALVALSAFDVPRVLQTAHIVLPIAAHFNDNDAITWHTNIHGECSSSLQIAPSSAWRKGHHNMSATPRVCDHRQRPSERSQFAQERWRASWCRRCGNVKNVLSSQQVSAISLSRVLETLTRDGLVDINELSIDNNGGELALLESLAPRTLRRSVHRILLACFDGEPLFQGATRCSEASASLQRLGFAVNSSQLINCHCGRRLLNASNAVLRCRRLVTVSCFRV